MRQINNFTIIKRYFANATRTIINESSGEKSFARMTGEIFS